MAGFVSSGVLRHEQIQIHASDLRGNRDSFTVVDVRSQSEYDSGIYLFVYWTTMQHFC